MKRYTSARRPALRGHSVDLAPSHRRGARTSDVVCANLNNPGSLVRFARYYIHRLFALLTSKCAHIVVPSAKSISGKYIIAFEGSSRIMDERESQFASALRKIQHSWLTFVPQKAILLAPHLAYEGVRTSAIGILRPDEMPSL